MKKLERELQKGAADALVAAEEKAALKTGLADKDDQLREVRLMICLFAPKTLIR